MPGMLSAPTLEGGLAGNVVLCQSPEVVGKDDGVVVGEGADDTRIKRMENGTRRPAERLVAEKPVTTRVTARSISAVARRNTNPSVALIRSAACMVVKAIRQRFVPTSSVVLRARAPRTAKTTVTPPSAAKRRGPSCVTCQASTAMSQIMREVVVCCFASGGSHGYLR